MISSYLVLCLEELAGVQYYDSDEILLPALETRPDELTSTGKSEPHLMSLCYCFTL